MYIMSKNIYTLINDKYSFNLAIKTELLESIISTIQEQIENDNKHFLKNEYTLLQYFFKCVYTSKIQHTLYNDRLYIHDSELTNIIVDFLQGMGINTKYISYEIDQYISNLLKHEENALQVYNILECKDNFYYYSLASIAVKLKKYYSIKLPNEL